MAGVLLLIAGLIAFQYRGAATLLANFVFLGSILVGLLGVYFHLSRTVLLESPGQEPVSALVWAPPLLGPLFFALVGILGISAAWIESPPDSGRLHLLRARTIRMPYSKTRAYFLIVSLFILAALISSVLDHARFNLESGWVWLPIIVSLFAMTASLTLGFIERPNRGDLALFAVSMIFAHPGWAGRLRAAFQHQPDPARHLRGRALSARLSAAGAAALR